MHAAVITSRNIVTFEQIPDPSPSDDEVVVAVRACGICGTDLHALEGDLEWVRYPLVPGHEFAGEVVARGREVSALEVGDLVAVQPNLYCGHCRQCRRGTENLCAQWNALGVTMNGAAAEYVTVPQWNAYRLPTGTDVAVGALIEPLSCALHGYDLVRTRIGHRFLIYGAGTMGLMLAMLAERAGALSVAVVEPNAQRRAMAARLAADAVVSADELDSPEGFDLVIDATGVVSAIEDGLTRVRRGGTFLQFGVAPAGAAAAMSPFRLYNDEVTMVGAMAVLHSYDRAYDLAIEGNLDLASLVSETLPLDAYSDAAQLTRSGRGYKIQVAPHTSS